MRILELLGLSKRRAPWQELVGIRPHLIEELVMDSGFGGMPNPEDDGDDPTYDVQDGIAIVQAAGVLVNDEEWWDGWGVSTYGRITREVMHAANNPGIEGIMIALNSPGGETDKAFETAAKITAAAKRKPLWCVADTSAYSAGYLLASCGSRLYVPPFSGGVGSIGVYTVHLDYSGALDQAGVKPTFLSAGKGKTDGHPFKPLSADARARIQADVDRLYGLFVDHVSARRGVPGGTIREFGARLFAGQEGIEAGLADRVGDTETALLEMREWLDSRAPVAVQGFAAAATAAQEVSMSEEVAAAAVEAKQPAAVEKVVTVHYADLQKSLAAMSGKTAEDDPVVAAREAAANTDRILAICATAGLSAQRAQEFIAAGQTPEQVSATLADERADESDKTEIVSQLQPHTSAVVEPTNVNESPIVRAAEKLAQKAR